MAMLTFLRIGKEIYDETEVYLIEHLLHRQQPFHKRCLRKIRAISTLGISKILGVLGLDDFI